MLVIVIDPIQGVVAVEVMVVEMVVLVVEVLVVLVLLVVVAVEIALVVLGVVETVVAVVAVVVETEGYGWRLLRVLWTQALPIVLWILSFVESGSIHWSPQMTR